MAKQPPPRKEKSVNPERLRGAWVHSHEEDQGNDTVFRPGSFPFPPSRGRYGFHLKAGGVLTTTGPSRGDVPEAGPAGSWTFEKPSTLVLRPHQGEALRYHLVAASNDKLVLRPV